MAEYTLLIILFAPFVGSIALVFVSNRQAMLVRGIAAGSAFVSLVAKGMNDNPSTPTSRREAPCPRP